MSKFKAGDILEVIEPGGLKSKGPDKGELFTYERYSFISDDDDPDPLIHVMRHKTGTREELFLSRFKLHQKTFETQFKPGDKVVSEQDIDSLKKGQEYEISSVGSRYITLKGYEGLEYFKERFRPIKPTPVLEQPLSEQVAQLEKQLAETKAQLEKAQTEVKQDNPLLYTCADSSRPYAPGRLASADLTFLTIEEAKTCSQARTLTMRYLRRIAQLNAEQGWSVLWDGKHPNYCLKLKNNAFPQYDQEVVSQVYKVTQTAPNHFYMSEATANQIMHEFTQGQLAQIIRQGVLGI